jgi:hypothetical protein
MQQQQFELQQEDEQRRQQLFLLQQKQQPAQNQAVLMNHELQQRPYQGQLRQRMFVQQQQEPLAPQIGKPSGVCSTIPSGGNCRQMPLENEFAVNGSHSLKSL